MDFIGTTTCTEWATPIGSVAIDRATIKELIREGDEMFAEIALKYEENEHSLEMHLPFIRKIFKDQVKLVPLMIGHVPEDRYLVIGNLLAKYLDDPQTLFIVSSDFCHWGKRFEFTHRFPADEKNPLRIISKSIEKLDRMALDLLEQHDLKGFKQYLEEYKNTICGSRPLKVMLDTI